ncbi:MAG: type II toxin-antitoxin system VapC family toxin [Chloroflexota bacterium]|nr:type II toxin-antitoxin system VapC family toxin [Chloroflexota bacterium]
MRLLLDTHTFIWWANEQRKLSPHVLALCQDSANTLLLSLAAVWEMQIKLQLGKMQLTLSLAKIITDQEQLNRINIMPIKLEHIFALDDFPMHHKDPFDRLMIAQAMVEGAVLLSRDPVFALYPVDVQW